MRRHRSPAPRPFSVVITALLLAVSFAVPVLDGPELLGQLVVETQHEPGECPTGHDHSVCTQVGANMSFPGEVAQRAEFDAFTVVRVTVDLGPGATEVFHIGHPSRAPPRI